MIQRVIRLPLKQNSSVNRLTKKRGTELVFRQPETLVSRSRVRIWPVSILVVIVCGLLLARLVQLTVVEGDYQRQQADQNRVLGLRTAVNRGVFLDRSDSPLVRNVPRYKRQLPGSSLHQAQFEEVSKEYFWQQNEGSGDRVFYDIKREYLCGRACAPLLGYLSEVTDDELTRDPNHYILGDLGGQSGLEKALEDRLRGQAGSQLIEVNAQGQEQRVLGEVKERSGTDVKLTLDTGLQKVLYDSFGTMSGAAVAQVPKTGEILALVSVPAFDPNNISHSLQEPGEPFFNRALNGEYPPGSVFKVVTAVAGLEEGKVTGETTIEDTGEIRIDTYRYGNWLYDQYGRTEGLVNMVKALQRSNDIYFYKVGEAVGPEALHEWALTFGFNKIPGLTGFSQSTGVIPSPSWKEKVMGERWFLGNTYHMAIGQGDVLVTPLQVNRMMGVIAADGRLCPPVVVADEVGKNTCQQLTISENTLALVKEGLTKACAPGGTGVAFFRSATPVACKTGTAQQGGDTAHPHAWFTVYAPADDPQIVLTVLVEKGGQGSEVAAPIAKKGIEYWLEK